MMPLLSSPGEIRPDCLRVSGFVKGGLRPNSGPQSGEFSRARSRGHISMKEGEREACPENRYESEYPNPGRSRNVRKPRGERRGLKTMRSHFRGFGTERKNENFEELSVYDLFLLRKKFLILIPFAGANVEDQKLIGSHTCRSGKLRIAILGISESL
jgi:hypothetical protein